MAAAPALAQIIGKIEQETDGTGEVVLETAVTGGGSNANQCAPLLQFGRSGSPQDIQGGLQSDESVADDVEFGGGSFSMSAQQAQEREEKIPQAASASSVRQSPRLRRPASTHRAPSPPPTLSEMEARGETKEMEAKGGMTELPRTGGSGTSPLLGLGIGALLNRRRPAGPQDLLMGWAQLDNRSLACLEPAWTLGPFGVRLFLRVVPAASPASSLTSPRPDNIKFF